MSTRHGAVRLAALALGALGALGMSACDPTAPLRTLSATQPAWSLSVSPDTLVVAVGDTARVTAVVRDRRGRAMPGLRVHFSTGDPAVVAADSTGRIRALRRGVAEVLASVEGLRQRAIIVVD
jgi:uncharacterized protein YjdB